MLEDLLPRAEVPAPAAPAWSDVPAFCRRLRRGDEDAFAALDAAWGARLFRYAFVLARGDEHLAREVVQATWLRVLRHLRPLPDEAALWNWLAKAARHSGADLHRRSSRYRRVLDRFTAVFTRLPTETPDPEDRLQRALAAALGDLEDADRELLRLRYETPATLEEIGTALGIGSRAVEGRLARLRQRLRDAITLHLSQPES